MDWMKKAVVYQMIRIDAPHFCAGAIVQNGKIVKSAPIIKWMINKTVAQIMSYCKQKNWSCEYLRWTVDKTKIEKGESN